MASASELIKLARLQAGMTQSQLAERATTSQPTVAAYESGTKVPSSDTLDRLLRATGQELASRSTSEECGAPSVRRLLSKHRERILSIAREYGAIDVRVFGSAARGEDAPGSDVDFLVRFESGRTLVDQAQLRRALMDLLGRSVDVVSVGALMPRDQHIIRESRPL